MARRSQKRLNWRRLLLRILLTLFLLSLLPVILFRWVPIPGSAVMLTRLVNEQAAQHYDWTPWREISPWAALAVMAAEDQKFPHHHGIDFDSLTDAVADRLDGKPLRGASTISQQVARNLFLWQGRSFVRKGLEVYFTGLIELAWPKKRILEVYLNIAETGPRTFGVEPASQRYFDTPASQLTASQAALLAAVLPNPVAMHVDAPSEFVRQRQRWILRQMQQLGGIDYLKTLYP